MAASGANSQSSTENTPFPHPILDKRAEAALLQKLMGSALSPSFVPYVVRQGDTVQSIAQRFHDVAWLVRRRNGGLWNMAPGRRVWVWQWPFGAPYWTTRTYLTDRPQSYTIQAGDTLGAIATTLHSDVATLANQNALGSGSLIYAGQHLMLHHYTAHSVPQYMPGISASALKPGLLLTDTANFVGIDAPLVKALSWHESGWTMERGASGEIGMMQIMPETAKWIQDNLIGYPIDPFTPANNVLEGTVLLAYYLDTMHHDTHKALADYHSGDLLANKRNGVYIRAVLGLRAYFYHHPHA